MSIRTTEDSSELDQRSVRSPLGRVIAQQAAVAEMAQRALEERDLDRLLNDLSVLASRVLETELVGVLELAPDRRSLRVVSGVGWRPGVVGTLVVPAAAGSQSGYTLATGGPVIAEDFDSETRFAVSDTLREHEARSGISVRIGSADEPYGVLAAFTATPRAFSHDDAAFLQSLANVLGSAVARLRAEAELRSSRDEMAAIVANVTDGITVQARDGRLLYANDAAARLTGFPDSAALLAAPRDELMGAFELLEESGAPMALEHLPGRIALATGQPTPPTLVRFRVRATGEERSSLVQAVPVLDDAGRTTQVINFFRDVTEERRAERAQQLLAEAAGALAGTLSPDEAAHQLAAACVPRLADFAVVDLAEPDGSIRTAWVEHADPAKVALGQRFRELRPIRLDDPGGPARIVREGITEQVEISEQMLREAIPEAEQVELLIALGVRSYLGVPLVGRQGPLGALTLIMAESGRRFAPPDVRLAEELGARAGVALENARLYQAVDERRAELDTIIEVMAEAVLLFDDRGELRLSNHAAQVLFGGGPPASLAELRRRLARTPANGDEESAQASDGLPAEEPLEGEHRLIETNRWLEVMAYRSPVPPSAGWRSRSSVVVLRDVTEARAAQVAREAFLGVLSHELRTPITTIFGGSELLERDLPSDQRKEVVADVRAEAERLARMVEDLLVMSRVERGGVELADEPVLIQRLLPSLARSMEARWPGLQVELQMTPGLPAVRGDQTYLEQVVRNLLVNGVRYGAGLTHGVTVSASEADGAVVVRVLDRGDGPGTDTPERLFELFYRAPAARRVPGGAGIGLFVCRQLVEAMGGTIWARAREGGGSEFGFTLPVIEPDAYL